jgi:hypothetical protein
MDPVYQQNVATKRQHDELVEVNITTKMYWIDRMQYNYHQKNIGGSS